MNVVLNGRCKIEKKQVTIDEIYGTEVINWGQVGVFWCEIQDVLPSKSESIQSSVNIGKKQSRLRIRYTKNLDSSKRVIIGSDIYQFVSDFAELSDRQYLEVLIEKYTS